MAFALRIGDHPDGHISKSSRIVIAQVHDFIVRVLILQSS